MGYTNLLERLLTYIRINTRSNPASKKTPSTQSQIDFALNILKPEMEAVGLQDVHYLPENGYIIGTLPATDPAKKNRIGFISHMDTADYNAQGVNPQVIEHYDGDSIALGESGYHLTPQEFPQLKYYKGQTLITTDGSTLLGADDKAGIAEIITAMAYLAEHPEIKHGEIRVGFGPDEEIGVGADKFAADDFAVDFAYTVDGGPLGELQYETFNAAALEIDFLGRNVHPGTAKDQMINALQLAFDFHSQLPDAERPEKTAGYEGFYHLFNLEGNVEKAHSSYIIRDFDSHSFEERKALVRNLAEKMNRDYGAKRVCVSLDDQYYNMKQVLEKDKRPVVIAEEAMKKIGIKPLIAPIRGGTDGSKISFMGIPTPNLFAGGENMHGPFEFVSLQTMERAVDLIIEIVKF
ncbi:peptidase T [Streptococcus sp. H31]|uniref:peptidase T n=1 Tax=Streptococcus huangxiaojuni TaxID=3237239 RepID=UPI0034A2E350